jgi:hypothetical protein
MRERKRIHLACLRCVFFDSAEASATTLVVVPNSGRWLNEEGRKGANVGPDTTKAKHTSGRTRLRKKWVSVVSVSGRRREKKNTEREERRHRRRETREEEERVKRE